jgi:hypothetical protein
MTAPVPPLVRVRRSEQVAVAFAALPACVGKVAVGVKARAEVAALTRARNTAVSRALWRAAEAQGLLPRGLLG